MHFYRQVVFSITLIFLMSCAKKQSTKIDQNEVKSDIKYAKGFEIIAFENYKKLIIKTPYQNANESFEYIIYNKNTDVNQQDSKNQIIKTPINEIVVTSTTHIPMVELLQEEASIVGFPFTKYVSSEKTRKLIDGGNIQELGNQNDINTEILLDLRPEVVVGFSVASANKVYNTIEKAGIPVIYNGDWLEETPLGKAEWIKFFGLLFDKEKEADSIFKSIETNYLQAKQIAAKEQTKPTILSGAVMSKDIWNLPAGESFVAKFLEDANTDYLWRNTTGKGSLSLSFESVFEKGSTADFWIAPGYFTSKEQMLASNKLYADFKAFQKNKIYSPSLKRGKTGGVLYYELATTRPDLVLKDIIKITHPNVLEDHQLYFFEQIK